MSKIVVIGGGAWGTTLAQALADNHHEVMIYDVNQAHVEDIKQHIHPVFRLPLPETVYATTNLKEALSFSSWILLSLPTKVIRSVLHEINGLIEDKKAFINVSKGIEPETLKRVSQIVSEEIDKDHLLGFVTLTGPSHAEEVVVRKLTLLVAASKQKKLAVEVQHMFANRDYLRVYTSKDLIGCEVGGAAKNAIAVISGACTGYGLGENARAAVITRGAVEIVRIVKMMGGKKDTAFGLTGVGDLIVTASSENSRNFRAGKRLGQGDAIDMIFGEEKQTIEGFRAIDALHHFALEKKVELPMIDVAYDIIHGKISVEEGLKTLLRRELKEENF